MGVRPNTGGTFKGFTFDGIDSKTYGVYITQEAAYGAPERDIELISIAGRNGAYALDKGRFLNTTVTYKAGITATDEASFAAAIRDFRNALASRRGYCRLEDDYNTDEYRLAVYKSGLEVSARDILKAGEFTIAFDCQPQRFLKSGENEVEVADGGTITNPTLFESHPLLMVWMNGSNGSITINRYRTAEINDHPIGETLLSHAETANNTPILTVELNTSLLNTGDSLTANVLVSRYLIPDGAPLVEIQSITRVSGNLYTNIEIRAYKDPPSTYNNAISMSASDDLALTYGTSYTDTSVIRVTYTGGATVDYTITTAYDGSDTLSVTNEVTSSALYTGTSRIRLMNMYGYSTRGSIQSPIYIDLDIGEAYINDYGHIISVNNAVSLYPDLRVLDSGVNTIRYYGQITQLKIVPRWWRV